MRQDIDVSVKIRTPVLPSALMRTASDSRRIFAASDSLSSTSRFTTARGSRPFIISSTALALALIYQGLATRRPSLDAGPYAYAKAGFGLFIGFNSALGYWLSAWIGNVLESHLEPVGNRSRCRFGRTPVHVVLSASILLTRMMLGVSISWRSVKLSRRQIESMFSFSGRTSPKIS